MNDPLLDAAVAQLAEYARALTRVEALCAESERAGQAHVALREIRLAIADGLRSTA